MLWLLEFFVYFTLRSSIWSVTFSFLHKILYVFFSFMTRSPVSGPSQIALIILDGLTVIDFKIRSTNSNWHKTVQIDSFAFATFTLFSTSALFVKNLCGLFLPAGRNPKLILPNVVVNSFNIEGCTYVRDNIRLWGCDGNRETQGILWLFWVCNEERLWARVEVWKY